MKSGSTCSGNRPKIIDHHSLNEIPAPIIIIIITIIIEMIIIIIIIIITILPIVASRD